MISRELFYSLEEKYKDVKGETTISKRDDKILAEILERKLCRQELQPDRDVACYCEKCEWWDKKAVFVGGVVILGRLFLNFGRN